ncbi:hypothetical protein [Brevibacillus borstelensis]
MAAILDGQKPFRRLASDLGEAKTILALQDGRGRSANPAMPAD